MLRLKRLAAIAATGAALLIAAPGTAYANAPYPECESGASIIMCFAQSTGTTTWSITTYYGTTPITSTTVTAGGFLRKTCAGGRPMTITYSYVDAGGQTIYSDPGYYYCNSGPWP